MTCNKFALSIDSYLSKELPAEKAEEFEMHYFECDSCFARLKVEERLRSKEIPILLDRSRSVSPLQWLFGWKPAAAFAAVCLVMVAVVVMKDNKDLSRILELTDVPAPIYITSEIRGRSGVQPNVPQGGVPHSGVHRSGEVGTFDRAMSHYNKKEYADALRLLKTIQDQKENTSVVFFRGVCFLFSGSLEQAVVQFDRIIAEMNPSYYDEAFYYKAVALLRLNKEKEALEQLRYLSQLYSPYAPKAEALIKKIEQRKM